MHKGRREFFPFQPIIFPFCLLLFRALLWYDTLCIDRGRRREFPPRKYTLQKGEASGNGGSPCLFRIKGKAVSELYREKVDRLQAVEQQLMQQKADAQRAARELTEQARRDGDALLREAEDAVKAADAEALRRADEAGRAARDVMLSDAERTCEAVRHQAEQRMDAAVRAIAEKVVKR